MPQRPWPNPSPLLSSPLLSSPLLSSHPYRKQATRPLPPAVAPKFRKVWRSQIQQSALPPARPHLSQQGRAKPATVGSALPRVVWQIKEILPATPTRQQRVIWQVLPLAQAHPRPVITAPRSRSIPRPRPPLIQPALSSSPASAVSPATPSAAAPRPTPSASPARQPAAPVLINYLAHQGQQWLNQWGEAAISLQDSRTDQLQGSIALLLPLKKSQQQLLFTQGTWHRDQEGNLFSLGLGQRWLYAPQRYWGYNLFYDHRRQGHHQRLGVGLEQHSSSLTWTLNSYWPLSTRRLVDQGANWVRPARGLDLRLQYQPAQQPHWRVNLTAEHYFGTTRAAQGQSLRHHPTAVTLGVNYTPLPLLSAGYGLTLGTGKQRSHQLQLALRYHLGIPWSQQLDPQQVAAQSLIGNRLALVPRNLRMVLQQQPNDEIQLELLPLAPQPAGRQVTLAILLRSPRPLAEWRLEWRGDLLQQTIHPQINATRDQATVTLPRRPGTYTLQLAARNARGVVSYSNTLQIVVEALAVPAEKHQRAVVTKATPPPVLPPEPVTIPSLGQGNQPATTADRSSTPPAKNLQAVTKQPPKGESQNAERTPTRKNNQGNKKTCLSTATPPTRTHDSSTSSPGSERSVDGDGLENGVEENNILTKPLTGTTDNPMQGLLTSESAKTPGRNGGKPFVEASSSSPPETFSPKASSQPLIQTDNDVGIQPQSDAKEIYKNPEASDEVENAAKTSALLGTSLENEVAVPEENNPTMNEMPPTVPAQSVTQGEASPSGAPAIDPREKSPSGMGSNQTAPQNGSSATAPANGDVDEEEHESQIELNRRVTEQQINNSLTHQTLLHSIPEDRPLDQINTHAKTQKKQPQISFNSMIIKEYKKEFSSIFDKKHKEDKLTEKDRDDNKEIARLSLKAMLNNKDVERAKTLLDTIKTTENNIIQSVIRLFKG